MLVVADGSSKRNSVSRYGVLRDEVRQNSFNPFGGYPPDLIRGSTQPYGLSAGSSDGWGPCLSAGMVPGLKSQAWIVRRPIDSLDRLVFPSHPTQVSAGTGGEACLWHVFLFCSPLCLAFGSTRLRLRACLCRRELGARLVAGTFFVLLALVPRRLGRAAPARCILVCSRAPDGVRGA